MENSNQNEDDPQNLPQENDLAFDSDEEIKVLEVDEPEDVLSVKPGNILINTKNDRASRFDMFLVREYFIRDNLNNRPAREEISTSIAYLSMDLSIRIV